MSEPDQIQIKLRDEAIGAKADCEHMLEMTDSKLADAEQRKEEAVEKYLEVKDNMTPQQITVFHGKIALGDGLKATGNAAYIRGSQGDHSADNYFNTATTKWENGQWHAAALDYAASTVRYLPASEEYGMAESQYAAALSEYDDAYSYALGFEEQP